MLSELATKYANKVQIIKRLCSLVVKTSKFQHVKLLKREYKTKKRLKWCSVADPNT